MHTLRTLWGACHPGPTLVVTALSTGLGLAVGLSAWRLLLLAAVIFAGQVSIGLSNDARDAARDQAVGRTDKPLAQPGAPVRLAWGIAVTLLLAAIAGTLPLGWGAALAHAVLLASGWAYNLWLKSTVWSAACFALAFGGLPSIVFLARPAQAAAESIAAGPGLAPVWATLAGAALGVAIHFSNVLPDFEADRLTGVRGLPHRLGARVSALVVATSLAAGAASVAVATARVAPGALAWVTWAGALAVVGLAAWAWISTRTRGATRLGFRLVMAAAAVLVAQAGLAGALGA